MITSFINAVVLPPGGPLLLAAGGLVLLRRYPQGGRVLIAAGLLTLYLLSTPLISNTLIGALQPSSSLNLSAARAAGADAIVLLAGGLYRNAPEYGGDSVGELSLGRARYAALLARETGLPVLISGGVVNRSGGGRASEAQLIARLLIDEFGVDERIVSVETRSRTTLENARYSAELLRETRDSGAPPPTILLVTHAIHMPRAGAAFRAAGIDVITAPTLFFPTQPLYALVELKPGLAVLARSRYALYELLGRVWYKL